jgi:hypothetical protein
MPTTSLPAQRALLRRPGGQVSRQPAQAYGCGAASGWRGMLHVGSTVSSRAIEYRTGSQVLHVYANNAADVMWAAGAILSGQSRHSARPDGSNGDL